MCDQNKSNLNGGGLCVPSNELGKSFGCAKHAELGKNGNFGHRVCGYGLQDDLGNG